MAQKLHAPSTWGEAPHSQAGQASPSSKPLAVGLPLYHHPQWPSVNLYNLYCTLYSSQKVTYIPTRGLKERGLKSPPINKEAWILSLNPNALKTPWRIKIELQTVRAVVQTMDPKHNRQGFAGVLTVVSKLCMSQTYLLNQAFSGESWTPVFWKSLGSFWRMPLVRNYCLRAPRRKDSTFLQKSNSSKLSLAIPLLTWLSA